MHPAPIALLYSSLPLIGTFLFVSTAVFQRLFPFLSGEIPSLKVAGHSRSVLLARPNVRQISAFVCSSTFALAAVLVELILCEVSNFINPIARATAFQVVVTALLLLLIVAIPFLEIHSVISSAGWQFGGQGHRTAWFLQIIGSVSWLTVFWWSGDVLLNQSSNNVASLDMVKSIGEGSLDRIGVIGISVMSLLSGFASVSSPWQTLFSRPRPVSETSVARKAAGLEATHDMLATKRSRLRALEKKLCESPTESFFQKAVGSFRGNADQTEKKTLLLEISGLETMALSLSSSHTNLQTRLSQQNRARTATGRLMLTAAYCFALFCLYRIATTFLTFTRRSLSSHHLLAEPLTTSDPVDNILAILAKHYDPHLDQASWARQISFFLSGIILFASFSSVMQTFRLFTRFLPSLLKTIQANLALVVAQVCATYVISAALMLRGMVPGDMVGEGLGSLGGGKDNMGWVDGWFEKWFLAGVVITSMGIWIGKKARMGSSAWDDDDDYDDEYDNVNEAGRSSIEMGKLS